MVAIRKSRAKPKTEDTDSAVMDLPHGAHLKVKSTKYFGPKFGKSKKDEDNPNVEETFWNPKIRVRFVVVDDRTEDGDHDGDEFSDDFDLKLDLDLLDETGFDESRLKGNPVKSSFSEEEREMLLNEKNWTVRDDTKLDKYNIAALGKPWTNGTLKFDEDVLVGTEVIAAIVPRSGKKKGSFCVWNTFLSVHPPKKQKKGKGKDKIQEAQAEAQEAMLTDEEVEEMEAALGKS
jgi:hypothetical protein